MDGGSGRNGRRRRPAAEDDRKPEAARPPRGTPGAGSGRKFTNAVETGWAPKASHTASDVLYLSGMTYGLGTVQTDPYTLSMTYDPEALSPRKPYDGLFGLSDKDDMGVWINAVDRNIGGSKKFVMGAWDPSFGLGIYGFDPSTDTAWAVINYNANLAVAEFASSGHRGGGH